MNDVGRFEGQGHLAGDLHFLLDTWKAWGL